MPALQGVALAVDEVVTNNVDVAIALTDVLTVSEADALDVEVEEGELVTESEVVEATEWETETEDVEEILQLTVNVNPLAVLNTDSVVVEVTAADILADCVTETDAEELRVSRVDADAVDVRDFVDDKLFVVLMVGVSVPVGVLKGEVCAPTFCIPPAANNPTLTVSALTSVEPQIFGIVFWCKITATNDTIMKKNIRILIY